MCVTVCAGANMYVDRGVCVCCVCVDVYGVRVWV